MAFTLWTTANLEPGSRPPSGITFTKIDTDNWEITLRHHFDLGLGITQNGAPVLGRTNAVKAPDTGLILTDPKIVISWDNNDVTQGPTYKKVGLHEIGHLLGLDHMSYTGPSVMNNASELEDYRGFVSQVVTECDRNRAREAIAKTWVP